MVPKFQPERFQLILPIPLLNMHPMQTRSKSGIIKRMAVLSTVHENRGINLTTVEPATYKSALKSSV